MSDLTEYARARAARDPEFADNLEAGYEGLKVGVPLRQAKAAQASPPVCTCKAEEREKK